MRSLFGTAFCLLYTLNQCSPTTGQVRLINRHRSETYYKPYNIVQKSRTKRNEKNDENQKDDIHGQRCDEDSYTKLYSCSRVNECTLFSSCLSAINCPSNRQSYGSLMVNLLHLLGSDHCYDDHPNISCPYEKRQIILQKLLKHWTDTRMNFVQDGKIDQSSLYCKNIYGFVEIIEQEIKFQCSFYSSQVEAFLENYLCPINQNDNFRSKDIQTTDEDLDYVDEDKSLNFLETNHDLTNNTEQTVYLNDHQYYNVSYLIPKSGDIPINFIPDYKNKFIRIHALANRHRSAFIINLKFDLPFYGRTVNRVLIGTGGFIYTGDLFQSSLIDSTQYIAPFMANFDVAIGGNQSSIKYFDNSTHFVCTWNQLYLQDQQEAGPFTFQTIFDNQGNIYFNYLRIPDVMISTQNHIHRIGLSDASISERHERENSVRIVTLYEKIVLPRDRIRSGISVILTMDNTCNKFIDCSSCLANRGKRYNCSWCDDIGKCFDGYDHSRGQWSRPQCHRLASENICPTRFDDSHELDHFAALASRARFDADSEHFISPSNGIFSTFRTIVISLFFTVVFVSVVLSVVGYAYAYRNPTSPIGMWLIEHRPSQYVARFRRFVHDQNTST